ncbi:MAG: hypothetical protein JW751_04885, partial [Polyangiaceae bacterium]|nr:hypothetical protein [Polyangiaceae bacterium]
FRGATPDEVFFGLSDSVEPDLIAARRRTTAARIAANRALECSECHALEPPSVVEAEEKAA